MADRRKPWVQQTIDIATIASTFSGWFSANDVYEIYRDEIAKCHPRTIYRYLHQLEQAGLLEKRQTKIVIDGFNGCVVRLQFAWVGWPGVIQTRKTRFEPTPFSSPVKSTKPIASAAGR